jgi:hypothetical protein
MPSADYERFRQQLERQLRADIELIFEAYQTKLRASETVARPGGTGRGSRPAAARPSRR